MTTPYKIGNILRGYIEFSADNPKYAWTDGCDKFNASFPSDSTLGRQVELYVKGPVPTTSSYKSYDGSVPDAWFPILVGYSKEAYPGDEDE